jgi:hypothetical protein
MRYINIKTSYGVETIDQFETYKEALKMVKEYNLSDPYNYYYISQRCTKEWREA